MSERSDNPNSPGPQPRAERPLRESTRASYEGAWARFERWSRRRGYDPLASDAVIDFLGERALRYSLSTLWHDLSAVADAYARKGLPHPMDDARVRNMWGTIKAVRDERERDRSSGELPEVRVAPDAFLTPRLRAMLDATPDDLLGRRDRLALIAGAAASLTRTQLVRLEHGDIEDVDDPAGAVIVVHPSDKMKKAHPDWSARRVRVAPAKNPSHDLGQAVEAWTEASGVGSGRLLRSVTRHGHVGDKLSVRALNILVRRAAERAGLESEGYMAEVRLASP